MCGFRESTTAFNFSNFFVNQFLRCLVVSVHRDDQLMNLTLSGDINLRLVRWVQCFCLMFKISSFFIAFSAGVLQATCDVNRFEYGGHHPWNFCLFFRGQWRIGRFHRSTWIQRRKGTPAMTRSLDQLRDSTTRPWRRLCARIWDWRIVGTTGPLPC